MSASATGRAVEPGRLDDLLLATRARYAAARPASRALHDRATRVLPGGHTRTVLHFDPFPFRVTHADGPWLVDADGHRYADLLGNYTAGLLGHAPAAVRDAVAVTLDRGWSVGATQAHEVELAELVTARFPSIERIRFTNSGTEANVYAISAALHATGRRGVLAMRGGYHGGVLTFGDAPSPINVPHDYHLADFNDAASLDAPFAAHAAGTAPLGCAIVEPLLGSAGCIPGTPEFLGRLRELCDAHDVPLIFDEVMTSRLGPAGLQGELGIAPDLTTLGKYLGGGFSFGAFGGRADVMSVFSPHPMAMAPRAGRAARPAPSPLAHAGTFNNNPVSMSAGVAALRHVLTPGAVRAVNARGDALREALNAIFADCGVPLHAAGRGSMMNVHGTPGPVRTVADAARGDDRWKELYFFAMLERGYYLARRGFIALSLEVTDEILDGFVAATRDWAASAASH
ncbi:MAG: aspartate aminotransferase family protein [Ilumatobacteraceae bacterium]